MANLVDNTYQAYLLPKRLVFFDLDGTIIPSTNATGRRIAIAIYAYGVLKIFAKEHLQISNLPDLDNKTCSQWHREHSGPLGLIKNILYDVNIESEMKKCLSFYFNGIFNERLEQYKQEDLAFDSVSENAIQFLESLSDIAHMVLVSYRYQPQREFYSSLKAVGLIKNNLFGPHNAFSVGGPSSSADGSKARFVGKMWRREIRAQRRLTSNTGETFPPFMVGDSIRDLHFAADSGGVFLGVSETGVDSRESLMKEIKELGSDLDTNSRIFTSINDPHLQETLVSGCTSYMAAL